MRQFARLLFSFCILLPTAGLGARPSSVGAPLVLKISVPEPGRLRVILRNISARPVHVFLGTGDSSGHMALNISLMFTNASGKTYKMCPVAFPVAGSLRLLNEVIAAGKEWETDVNLKTFMEFCGSADPCTAIAQPPSGPYTVYAVFEGRSINLPANSLPYWVGTIQSEAVRIRGFQPGRINLTPSHPD